MCNPEGSEDNFCNIDSGHCYCKTNVAGHDCDQCVDGSFGFPECQCESDLQKEMVWSNNSLFSSFIACLCNEEGAVGTSCEDATGKCSCRPNIIGNRCDKCGNGFFSFPNCEGNTFEFM